MSSTPVSREPLVALLSGVPTAVAPATDAVHKAIPTATVWNVLDDRLITDATDLGAVTARLEERMERLIHHVIEGGAEAVLITCSLYAHLGQRHIDGVPISGSDDAAFAATIAANPDRVLLVSSVQLAGEDSQTRLRRAAGPQLPIELVIVSEAVGAAASGDYPRVAQLVHDQLSRIARPGDVVLFAQYSLAPAGELTAQLSGYPVLTAPAAAAAEIRARLGLAPDTL